MTKRYASNGRAYYFRFRPASDTSLQRHIDDQFLGVQHSTQSIVDALDRLGQGVVAGELVGLSNTGVIPGTYDRATVTVGADGRVTSISEGPEPISPIPYPSTSGLVLLSGSGGSYAWQPSPSGLPTGGTAGQVLTRTATGTTWTTPAVVETTAPITIRSLYDLDISDGATIGDGIFEAELRPTGVQPGTYTAATITVDAKGRILSARNGTTGDSAEALRNGTYRYWRLILPGRLSEAPRAIGAVEWLETVDGTAITGSETRETGSISITFPDEVAISALRITATTTSVAPSRIMVQGSIDGTSYFEVWAVPTKGWTDGETRIVQRPGFVTLTGAVTGSGADSIVTTLAPTGVVAGSYKTADVTVGADGRITSIAAGEVPEGPGGGSFDPDTPLDYLTMRDTVTGDDLIVSIASGSWVFEPAGIPLEDGSILALEDGSGSISPEA